ncbi:MAG: hypothetical protein LLF95_11250 [Bacteroidales bacterium]|nr:hypothetical protein [Bacteroidales bacterium]
MNHSLEYWKKRCELAEKVIDIRALGVDQDELKAWMKWKDIKNSAKAGIDPEENILSFGINEIKALDLYVTAMRNSMSKVGELTPGRSQDFDNLFMHINNLKMLAGINDFDEERERAIKFMDKPIKTKHDSEFHSFGYRVHEKDLFHGINEKRAMVKQEPDESISVTERLSINNDGQFVVPDRLHEADEAPNII